MKNLFFKFLKITTGKENERLLSKKSNFQTEIYNDLMEALRGEDENKFNTALSKLTNIVIARAVLTNNTVGMPDNNLMIVALKERIKNLEN